MLVYIILFLFGIIDVVLFYFNNKNEKMSFECSEVLPLGYCKHPKKKNIALNIVYGLTLMKSERRKKSMGSSDFTFLLSRKIHVA